MPLIYLGERHLQQQRWLFLYALAHSHRGFRDPGAGWLGSGVLMLSLITSYNWCVFPGKEGEQSLDNPWCRF